MHFKQIRTIQNRTNRNRQTAKTKKTRNGQTDKKTNGLANDKTAEIWSLIGKLKRTNCRPDETSLLWTRKILTESILWRRIFFSEFFLRLTWATQTRGRRRISRAWRRWRRRQSTFWRKTKRSVIIYWIIIIFGWNLLNFFYF